MLRDFGVLHRNSFGFLTETHRLKSVLLGRVNDYLLNPPVRRFRGVDYVV